MKVSGYIDGSTIWINLLKDFQFIIDVDTIFGDCGYVWGINEGILPDLLGQDALQYCNLECTLLYYCIDP